jgi:hypothetical protein
MSGFDVLEAYLKGSQGGDKKVVAMALRSAQEDISRATESGIPLLLKPFTRADVKAALEHLLAPNGLSTKKFRFLTVQGKIRILDCPADKSSKFRIYAESLGSEIIQEIDEIVREDQHLLIIRIGEGFLSHKLVRMNFAKLLDHIEQILTVRLVTDSADTRNMLKQFPQTANLPIDVSLECALSSIDC